MHDDLPFDLTLDTLQHAPVKFLLSEIKRWLSRTNPSCLVHPHGFYVVPLMQTDLGDWRFHLWAKGRRRIRGMPAFIHNHDRHVESRILMGQLKNVTYEIIPAENNGYPLYEVGYSGNRYRGSTKNSLVKTCRRVIPRVLDTNTSVAGGFYRVERFAFHEAIVPEDTCTATLVWMHSKQQGAVSVVGQDKNPDRIEFQRVEYSGVHVAEAILSD